MILFFFQDPPADCDVCLGYLSLGGIIALAAIGGFLICTVLNKNPTADLEDSLISNEQALKMIENLGISDPTAARSGHLDLGVLVAYIDRMKSKCSTAGKPMTGLEYFFAQYGANEHTPNGGQNTILFYPTYQGTVNGVAGNIPFDPDSSAASVKDMNDVRRTNGALNNNWTISRNVLNRTHMSPPNPPLTL